VGKNELLKPVVGMILRAIVGSVMKRHPTKKEDEGVAEKEQTATTCSVFYVYTCDKILSSRIYQTCQKYY
jgi:hypothetical protein